MSDRPAASPARVVYLGFDACDAGIVSELAAAGELPTFARVLAEGASIETLAPLGVFPSAVWPTFATGLTPDHHRLFCWCEVEAGGYEIRMTDPSEIQGTPFFVTLSDRGRRVAVLDVPHTRAVEGLNGVMLAEWGCHDRHGGATCWPASLLDELEAEVGPHAVGRAEGPGFPHHDPSDYLFRQGSRRTTDEVAALFEALCRGHEQKRQLTLSVLDEGGWDLFAAVFSESHCTGHQLWHVHDEGHPWHVRADRDRIGSPIVELYRRLDRTLAEHLDAAGPDTPVFVHLSHGMGPHYDGTDVLEHVLRLVDDPEAAAGGRVAAAYDALPASLRSLPVRAAGRIGPAGRAWRRWLATRPRRTLPDLPPESVPAADRIGRRWFAVPNNTVTGAVRLNVLGREADGVVAPGDVGATCDELAGILAELVNIDTGEPLVLAVVRADDGHERRDRDPFPDLFVEWNRSAPIERVWSPRFGAIEVPRTHWRTGDHTRRGLFVALGPGIEPGRRGGPIGVEHLAPTIAAAVGERLPDVDGRPIAGFVAGPDRLGPDQAWLVPPDPDDGRTHPSAGQRARRLGRDLARTWLRDVLELDDVDRRLDDTAGSLAVLSDQHTTAVRELERVADRAGAAADRAASARTYAEYVNGTVEAVAEHLGAVERRLAELHEVVDVRTLRLLREAQVHTTMVLLELVDPPEDLLVTVVMATRDRAGLLPRSIGSVLAQEYPNWELIVVDDGSTDDTRAVLDRFADPRLRRASGPGRGCGVARNVGLDRARGDVVVYLDDDNVLHPRWLKSVAWAFSQHPEVDVVLGARVIDDIERVHDVRRSGGDPWIQFEPFDRERLAEGNTADVGVIAHRAGLPGARFDEGLQLYGDWDLFQRLTADKDPLELAAIAIAYTTDGPNRLSEIDPSAEVDRIQARIRSGAAAVERVAADHPEVDRAGAEGGGAGGAEREAPEVRGDVAALDLEGAPDGPEGGSRSRGS